MKAEEQNDFLLRRNKIAIQRYDFAVNCLAGKKYIADVACGCGCGSYILRQAGHDVIGIDHSFEAISYAYKNYPGNYLILDIENNYLPHCDVTVSLETICHLKNPQKFIDKINSRRLIISAPIDPNKNDGYIFRLHNLSEIDFRNLLKNWRILKEFSQRDYLTFYCEKL